MNARLTPVAWLEEWWHRAGRGVLRLRPGRMLGLADYPTLPPAGPAFTNTIAPSGGHLYYCDGATWTDLGETGSLTTVTVAAWTLADAELAFGTAGQFTLCGSGLTPGTSVIVRQVPGDVPDELEFAQISAAGLVTAPDEITCYWTAAAPMTGPIRVAWQLVS